MKKFTIDNTEYNLPESYSDVTWAKYLEMLKVIEDKDLDRGNFQKIGNIVSILTGVPTEIIESAESRLVSTLYKEMHTWLFNTDLGNLKPIQVFECNTDTYFVHSLADSKFKEFALYDKMLTDFEANPYEGYTLLLSILCRQDGETFDDIEGKLFERAELFNGLDVITIRSIAGFFLLNELQSQRDIEAYLRMESIRESLRKRLQSYTTRNTAGTPSLYQRAFAKLIIRLT